MQTPGYRHLRHACVCDHARKCAKYAVSALCAVCEVRQELVEREQQKMGET